MKKNFVFVSFFLVMSSVLFAQQIQPISVSSGHRAVTGAVLAELVDEILEYQGISSAINDYGLQFWRNRNGESNAWVLIPMSRAFSYPPNTSVLAQTRQLYDFLRTKRYWVEDLKISFVEEGPQWSHYISLIYTFNGRTYPVRINISYPG